MKRAVQLVLLLAWAVGLHAGEIVDRVIARVDHRVIMQSEFEDALRYQALTAGRSPDTFSAAERHEAFEDLVDQALIEDQISHSNYIPADQEAIKQQVMNVRRQIPGAEQDSAWRAMLQRYALTESDVEACVGR